MEKKRAGRSSQFLGSTDAVHQVFLEEGRQRAAIQADQFGRWARAAMDEPEHAIAEIENSFGGLPVEPAWSVLAQVYPEDTPDHLLAGACSFVGQTFREYGVDLADQIVNIGARAGGAARNLSDIGFQNIIAADHSRPMLETARAISGGNPQITFVHASPLSIHLDKPYAPTKGIAWLDYGVNLITEPDLLRDSFGNLLDNLHPGGCFIFDLRTIKGWQPDGRHRDVSTVMSDHFKRITVTTRDFNTGSVHMDRFFRILQPNGRLNDWRREQLTERMWMTTEVVNMLNTLDCTIEGIFGDDFKPVQNPEESDLVYFVVRKHTIA